MTRSSLALGVLALTCTVGTALAHPPPPPPDDDRYEIAAAEPARPLVEWSSWVRVAFGWAPEADAGRPRIIGPDTDRSPVYESGWETALGAELSLPLTSRGNLRFGPWAEVRTSSGPMLGGQLVLTARPAKLDLFLYEGEGQWMVRAGGNTELVTGAVAWGYRAPWDLFRAPRGSSRYMIGVRVVATATRSIDDPSRWSATLGLEAEPLGALRYLLGIRAWYR
jgi:hypothetical protein